MIATLAVSGLAAAGDAALAEVLFQQGKQLMAERRFAEACPKLAESQRLDPAGGTLTTLALCHEAEGKTATAWAEFGEVLADARRAGRADREAVAKERIAALEPKLSKLTVTVAPGTAAMPGVEIKRDGATLGRPAWGVPAPIDPGTHVVEATAPGQKPWKASVVIGGAAESKSIVVAELEPAGAAPRVASTETPRSSRTAAYVVGGVGLAFVAIGGVFGLQAISKAKSSNATCPNTVCADAGARDDSETAKRDATIADVGMGLGAVVLGVSAYLFFSGPSKPADAQVGAVRFVPSGGRDGIGGALRASW